MKLVEKSGVTTNRLISKIKSCERIAYETYTSEEFQIGYIISGEKRFIKNGRDIACRKGELFIIPIGQLCCENIAADKSSLYEQIAFSFNSAELSSMLAFMVIEAPLNRNTTICSTPAIFNLSQITHTVIESINKRYDHGGFINTPLSERINIANLIVSIFENEDEELKREIASMLDFEQTNFQRLIYNNVFINRCISELAEESNRSLTTFKKDFRRHFGSSPHSWFLRQRLNHAYNLLSTTNDTIAHIGAICTFQNTSHFIKLYKKHFGQTPAQHRIYLRRG